MPNKPTIAEILHYAADHELAEDNGCFYSKEEYSCCAISLAIRFKLFGGNFPIRIDEWIIIDEINEIIDAGLKQMGLNVDSSCEFNEFPEGPIRQAARYNWPKFVALLAEEQGV